MPQSTRGRVPALRRWRVVMPKIAANNGRTQIREKAKKILEGKDVGCVLSNRNRSSHLEITFRFRDSAGSFSVQWGIGNLNCRLSIQLTVACAALPQSRAAEIRNNIRPPRRNERPTVRKSRGHPQRESITAHENAPMAVKAREYGRRPSDPRSRMSGVRGHATLTRRLRCSGTSPSSKSTRARG